MMTKCSHNFCSLCIRKFLSYKLQCPVCNTQMTEHDLRNNRLLDDLVVNFQDVRQQLSKASFESPPISPKTPFSAAKCKTPNERGQKSNSSVLSHFFQKKSKTPPSKDVKQNDLVPHSLSQRKTLTHNDDPKKAPLSVKIKEEPADMEDTRVEMPHSSSPSTDVKPIVKVECPVCSVGVSQQFINKHLDMCLTKDEKKESLRSNLANKRRPMAKLVYNLLSMQELKRRLRENHLSTQGSRDQMIKRHQAFIQLYNAQCDSLNPKSVADIAKEVEADEKIKNQLQGKAKPVMIFSKTQTEEEIDKMHSQYRKQHSSDFSRLIAQVRGRRETHRLAKQEVVVEKQDATQSTDRADECGSSLVIKTEAEATDEEEAARGRDGSCSPTFSDVSISSSLSDIFGPETTAMPDVTERSSVQKRPSRSTEDNTASSSNTGKRRRKT